MSDRASNIEQEIEAIERKSDQQCTIHGWLRDKYRRRAAALDYSVMLVATYLLGLSLVEPVLGWKLSLGVDKPVLIALLSIVVFFLSIVQFKNGWKAVGEAHHRAFKEYAAVKSDCRTLTSGVRNITSTEHQKIRSRYDMVTELGTNIPDNVFVNGKAHHVRKVFVSRYLDQRPGAWPFFVYIKLLLRDNLGVDWLGGK